MGWDLGHFGPLGPNRICAIYVKTDCLMALRGRDAPCIVMSNCRGQRIKVSLWKTPFYGAGWLSTQGDMIVFSDSEELEAEGPDLGGY